GKCFSSTGPGSAPMSLGRFIIASPAAATGAAAAVDAGAAGLGAGVAAAGFGTGAATPLAVATPALPLLAGASAPASLPAVAAGASAPPSLRNRDGASSGKVVSGCNSLARASRTPSVSRFAGSGMQQSTGHTAAQASWSGKPTHSGHFDGTM